MSERTATVLVIFALCMTLSSCVVANGLGTSGFDVEIARIQAEKACQP